MARWDHERSGRDEAIRWLHLSDLHLGAPGKPLWWEIQNPFKESLLAWARRFGAPHLILLTGDLAYSGKEEEYTQVDKFLKKLIEWIHEEHPEARPLILAVPGNHDVAWPGDDDLGACAVLDAFMTGEESEPVRAFQKVLWREKDPSAKCIERLFAEYVKWFRSRIVPQFSPGSVDVAAGCASAHFSHFPYDFRVRLELPGTFPLVIVGLNSAWLQYRAGDFEEKLEVPREQFQAALDRPGASPFACFDRAKALLLLHHPPTGFLPAWFSRRGREAFDSGIYEPGRFGVCLFGHLHEGRHQSFAEDGWKLRYFFQAPSLCGVEKYGTREESRAFGFAFGTIRADGEVRVWPHSAMVEGGERVFKIDPAFRTRPDGSFRVGPFRSDDTDEEVPRPGVDWRPWLEKLLEKVGWVEVAGVSVGGGGEAEAKRYPIQGIYTMLRARWSGLRRVPVHDEGVEELNRIVQVSSLHLADFLPKSPRLLIVGPPGGGKTTFLHMIAAMAARDRLGLKPVDGKTWSEKYLGLGETWGRRVPVFLRLSRAADDFKDPGTKRRPDDRTRLLDWIEKEHTGRGPSREKWEGGIQGGEVLLLLDGLDEVADPDIRKRLRKVLRDAVEEWKDCPIVVTSRPFDTEEVRALGFDEAQVEPFGLAEMEEFTRRWVAALHGIPWEKALTESAEDYRKVLLDAIVDRPAIRRLAKNPVMLTCLCVVHWNEQKQLPEGRGQVYEAVLEWLLRARSRLRAERGYSDELARAAFRALALAMMGPGEEDRKRVEIGFDEAAEALGAVFARAFPELERKIQKGKKQSEALREKAKSWISFECQGSHIIEEAGEERLRFWHPTFLEYLAAVELNDFRDGDGKGKGGRDWWPVIRRHLESAQWRETVDLLPGCLNKTGTSRIDLLLERVLTLRRRRKADLVAQAWTFGMLARFLVPLEVYKYRPPSEVAEVYERTREASARIFTPEGASKVPWQKRIEIAEALGKAGDPWLDPKKNRPLPIPGHKGLLLGKYPVTVQEYGEFVEARGYEECRFWDEAGWEFRQKEGWTAPDGWDTQLERPNCPVVNVSWYEADAYCRWRSDETQWSVRLPSEAEWAAAATPKEGDYPWGKEEPTEEHANFGRKVGRPTPVGVYPRGAGPAGHVDLAGNVWEWCSDKLGEFKGLRKGGRDTIRPLRGGCCWHGAVHLRVGARLRGPASHRLDGFGFRVCVAPASR